MQTQELGHVCSLGMPDDGVSFHELLRALKRTHIVFSQHHLHGVGAKRRAGELTRPGPTTEGAGLEEAC